jgi:hypothetical protein
MRKTVAFVIRHFERLPLTSNRGTLLFLLLLEIVVEPGNALRSPAYPLKRSPNGRYLVDSNNVPVMLMGDSPQALMVNISEADADSFFANRQSHGFNTMWINLLCAAYTGGRTNASTMDGILPFLGNISGTSSYDLSKTNEVYFAHIDRVLNLAAQHGLQVLLDPAETGSFLSVMRDNGTNKCRAYGQFLGARYRNYPNIIWMSGNDFQTWRTASDDAVVRAVALGIQDMDTNHLQTTELDYVVSSSLDDTNWNSILTLNGTYTYYPTYSRLQFDYIRPNFLPNLMVEANYEFESLQGPVTTAPILRKQEYWTLCSGAAGQMYGNHYTWPFSSGWQSFLDTPGAIQIQYLTTFIAQRAWYRLVPDTNHTLVTSGYGTNSDVGHVSDNDYLTAARTADGTLALAYTPVIRQFTVDMSQLSAPVVARWFDPSLGVFAPISGSPFTNSAMRSFTPPGNNGDGDGGWLLVLETNPPPDPPPPPPRPAFIQQNSATPQSPQTQVSVPYPGPQKAGNANIIAIGWNDDTSSISGISDSAGNNYQVALATFHSNGLSQAIYYCSNIRAGSNTVSVTFNQAAAYVDLRVTEYSGLAHTNTFDVGASAADSSAIANCGPVNVGSSNELLFAAGMTATTFTGPGAGFAQRILTTPDGDLAADQVATAPGAYSVAATLNSGAWLMQLAVFKPAPRSVKLRASLTPSNTVVIAWPDIGTNVVLQEIMAATATNWTSVTNAIGLVSGESQVVMSPDAGQRYFRLKEE